MVLRVFAVTAAAFLLVSCGSQSSLPSLTPYRIEIQQGNFVSQEMVSQLRLGMTKDQVRFVLGTALIADSFHADRWDYVFRRQRANSRELEHNNVAVFFEDGKLKRIEGDMGPAANTDAATVRLPEAKPAAPQAAAPAAAAAPKPATTATPDQPVATSEDKKPQQKSWWERLKEKF